ncbi:MAG: helix-turn-helix domain-containing protein [Candidatus Omnitrophica bacterium]|nr:helix-turn-helix domain-containing protein [Candidatus Omnitrophota bacterium]
MEKLLTAQELSEYLKVKLSTIRKWCHYDYVPFLRLGGFVRFEEKKIDQWIRKRARKGRASYTNKDAAKTIQTRKTPQAT